MLRVWLLLWRLVGDAVFADGFAVNDLCVYIVILLVLVVAFTCVLFINDVTVICWVWVRLMIWLLFIWVRCLLDACG